MNGRARKPAGYTLAEVMIAMAISASMATVFATLLVRVVVANAAAADHLQGIVGLSRLGDQFRRDAGNAVEAEIIEQNGGTHRLSMNLIDQSQVAYEIVRGNVVRTRSAEGPLVEREAFTLGAIEPIEFTVDPGGSGEVAITLTRAAPRPGDEDVETGRFNILGVVALDHATPRRP